MSKLTINCDKCPTYNKKNELDKYSVGGYKYCAFITPDDSEDNVYIVRDEMNECKRICSKDKEYEEVLKVHEAAKVIVKLE